MALGDVREQRRAEEVAAVGQVAGRLVHLGALGDAGRDELGDLLELGLRIDRADVGVLVERVADADRREPVLELVDQRLVDRLLDEQPRARAADLALVEVDAVDDALDRLVERRVVEHDVGGLAAELEGQRLVGARRRPCAISLPISVEPVNATLSTPGWVTSAIPISPGPGTMLTTPGGRSAWRQTSANRSARERRRRRRLEDDRVARGERRRDLPGEHQQREVPRDDLGGDAERPRDPARERVLELVRPAGVVPEVRGRERDVDVARSP